MTKEELKNIRVEINKLPKIVNPSDKRVCVPITDVFDIIDNHISAEEREGK